MFIIKKLSYDKDRRTILLCNSPFLVNLSNPFRSSRSSYKLFPSFSAAFCTGSCFGVYGGICCISVSATPLTIALSTSQFQSIRYSLSVCIYSAFGLFFSTFLVARYRPFFQRHLSSQSYSLCGHSRFRQVSPFSFGHPSAKFPLLPEGST